MTLPSPVFGLLVGLLVGWSMHFLMRLISRSHQVPVDMVQALGTFGTGEVGPQARRIGFVAHSIGGAVLGVGYDAALGLLHFEGRPAGILIGSVLGFFHGLLVTYFLMYWLAERHPVERFRRATMVVGLVHLAGHIYFGTVVAAVLVLSRILA